MAARSTPEDAPSYRYKPCKFRQAPRRPRLTVRPTRDEGQTNWDRRPKTGAWSLKEESWGPHPEVMPTRRMGSASHTLCDWYGSANRESRTLSSGN
jgi:hypothetical protein